MVSPPFPPLCATQAFATCCPVCLKFKSLAISPANALKLIHAVNNRNKNNNNVTMAKVIGNVITYSKVDEPFLVELRKFFIVLFILFSST